jgi:RNA polymerase subunit RPABC4/transcription elongation factor Spt4
MVEAFFFLIGGIQPKIKVLDPKPQRCPLCGLNRAYTKRVDHYLSLFFIPILKVKTGEPILICDRCERSVAEFKPELSQAGLGEAKTCRFCSKTFDSAYSFCPFCGRRL